MIDWLGRLGAMGNMWLGALPTTNTRIAVSVLAFLAVIGVWLILAVLHALIATVRTWEPSLTMLGFISLWGGLDVVQFMGKRLTTKSDLMAAGRLSGSQPAPPNALKS